MYICVRNIIVTLLKSIFMRRILLSVLNLCIAVTGIYAQFDDQMKLQRKSFFEVIPITSNDIVFIGNSITNGGEWQEFFPEFSVKDRGISGDKTTDVLNRLAPIVSGKPAKVFIKIGINDWLTAANIGEVAGRIEKIIDEFQTKSPTTKIYLETVLPCDRFPVVKDLNTLLAAICVKRDVAFLDVFSVVKDEAGMALKSNYTNDNTHLLGSGYSKWAEFLMPHVGATELGIAIAENVTQMSNFRHAYCNQRVTEFELLKGKNADVLFVGDDVIDCIEWSEAFRNKNVKGRGVGVGVGTSPWIDQIGRSLSEKIYKPYTEVKPAKVFIYAGANDIIKNNKTAAFVKGEMKKMIDYILAQSSSTEVYIQGYLPHSNATESAKLIAANTELQNLVSSYTSRVTYVDLFSAFKQSDNNTINEKYTLSNNALNGRGFLHWANTVYTYIDPAITPVPEPEDVVVTMPACLIKFSDIVLDGTKPYKLSEEDFNKIKDLEEGTIVATLRTSSVNPTGTQFLFSASDNTDAFGYMGVALNGKDIRIQMAPITNSEGWYTIAAGKDMSYASDVRVVLRGYKSTKTLTATVNKNYEKNINLSTNNPTYRFIKDNAPRQTNGFYFGGIVTSDNANKYPLTGIIKNISIYETPLTTEELRYLNNNWDEVTTINESTLKDAANIYGCPGMVTIVISDNELLSSVFMYNTCGQVVASYANINVSRLDIDTQKLPKGIHIVRAVTNKGVSIAKTILVE